MSCHGLETQIKVALNTMFQHSNSLMLYFIVVERKKTQTVALFQSIGGHIRQADYSGAGNLCCRPQMLFLALRLLETMS